MSSVTQIRFFSLLFFAMLSLFCPREALCWNFVADTDWIIGKNDSYDGNLRKIGAYGFSDLRRGVLALGNVNYYNYREQFQGVNLGVGVRGFLNRHYVVGANLYYDYQDESSLHQVGVGGEILSRTWCVHGNIYIPVGKCEFGSQYALFDDYIGDYEILCHNRYVVAKAFDFRVSRCFQLHPVVAVCFVAGCYGLDFCSCSGAIGALGRVTIKILEGIQIEPRVSTDKIYGTKFSVRVGFYYPLYGGPPSRMVIYRPIRRQGVIQSRKCCQYETNY